jgi:hypothetical protein
MVFCRLEGQGHQCLFNCRSWKSQIKQGDQNLKAWTLPRELLVQVNILGLKNLKSVICRLWQHKKLFCTLSRREQCYLDSACITFFCCVLILAPSLLDNTPTIMMGLPLSLHWPNDICLWKHLHRHTRMWTLPVFDVSLNLFKLTIKMNHHTPSHQNK